MRRKLIQTFVEAISLTVGALLPVMNPFSTAPLFVSLTANFEPRRRRGQVFRACAYAFGILVTFLLAGAAIIDFFGISIPGIRSAGGLVILAIGSRMLFPAAKAAGDADSPGAAPDLDVAFSPLAMPSLAGPGSIAVVMSAAAQIRSERPNDWVLIYAAVIAGMAATLVVSYLVLRLAGTMVRFMGRTGIDAMTRIFGFLLICIGMQFLLTGIADFYGLHVGSAPAAPVSPARAEGNEGTGAWIAPLVPVVPAAWTPHEAGGSRSEWPARVEVCSSRSRHELTAWRHVPSLMRSP